tara:strand:+ start:1288 stop:1548 length:261 start_codon:yes stop_codon:yes gene_type:complete
MEIEKTEHLENYIRSYNALDEAMKPYQDQKRDLRKNYISNRWLSAEEIKNAVRVYRLLKQDANFSELSEFYDAAFEAFKSDEDDDE